MNVRAHHHVEGNLLRTFTSPEMPFHLLGISRDVIDRARARGLSPVALRDLRDDYACLGRRFMTASREGILRLISVTVRYA